MYDENWEKDNGVCRGCLSSDRRLSPLVHSELYTILLNKNEKDMDKSVVLFCWECAALMQRLYRFQLQTQKADKMLSESLETFLIKKSLSKLIISHKQDYDTIIEESYDTSDKLDIYDTDDKVEDSQHYTVVNKNEGNDSDGAERFDDEYFDLEVSSDEENTQNEENEISETINEQSSRKRKHDVETIEFVAASLVTKRRSERLKEVMSPSSTLKEPKLKTVKGKKKRPKGKKVQTNLESKAEIKRVNIKIQNEIEIDISKSIQCLSDVEDRVTENSNKNECDVKSDIKQKSDNLVGSTRTIRKKKVKSEGSDSDSNKDDPDYCEEDRRPERKAAVRTDERDEQDEPRKRYKYKKIPLLRRVIVRFEHDQLDEFFSKVEVADETIEDVLKSEPKYTTEERPFGCEYCGRCYEVLRHLKHHQRMTHKQIRKAMSIKDPNSPLYYRYSMYRCSICDSVLRVEHTEAHMKYLHRFKFVCTECDALFWARGDADAHARTSHTKFQCNLCNAVKSRKRYLDNHIETWHTPVTCGDCDEQFPSRKYLLKHREDKHPDTNPELRYCVQCNIQFRSIFAYNCHLRYTKTHRTEEPEKYPCSECNAVLMNKYSLNCHRDRFHCSETRFQCTQCGKFYARKSGLQTHIATAHLKVTKPKDKICSYCGRGFSNNRILIHHIRTHTGERPHQCTYCPAAFAQPFPLKKHLATVHKHVTDGQNVHTDSQALERENNSVT